MKALILYGIHLVCCASIAMAADSIPYSIKSIANVGGGYVELVGPGKSELVPGETIPYEGTKYVKTKNIGTLTGVEGTTKGCMIAYESEGYTENISVKDQSCNEVLEILKSSNAK